MKNIFCFTICFFVLLSCSSETIIRKNSNQLDDLIKLKKWENVSQIPNEDNKFILIINQKKLTNLIPSPELSYIVYDSVNNLVVYEEELIKGKVRWLDNESLRVSLTPGNITDNEKDNEKLFGYTINVKTKNKIQNRD